MTEHSGARIEAFQHLREGIERYLRNRLRGSWDEAKELLQEAYTRLLEQPVERELAHWKAWLWVTVRNLANTRDQQRKNHRVAMLRLEATPAEDARTPESLWGDQQEQAAIERAITELPGRQRQVIALLREGRTQEQIALALGISERTCRRDLEQAQIDIRNKIGWEQPK